VRSLKIVYHLDYSYSAFMNARN